MCNLNDLFIGIMIGICFSYLGWWVWKLIIAIFNHEVELKVQEILESKKKVK
jgi:hypothetical protein